MNWMPGNTKQGTFTIVVAILLLVCARVGCYINNPAEYFSTNLLPELTGMLIELCIILFIVDRWQEAKQSSTFNHQSETPKRVSDFFLTARV